MESKSPNPMRCIHMHISVSLCYVHMCAFGQCIYGYYMPTRVYIGSIAWAGGLLSYILSVFGNSLSYTSNSKNLLSHTHDFYLKSEYSKIVHFKGVSVILVYNWQVVRQNTEND